MFSPCLFRGFVLPPPPCPRYRYLIVNLHLTVTDTGTDSFKQNSSYLPPPGELARVPLCPVSRVDPVSPWSSIVSFLIASLRLSSHSPYTPTSPLLSSYPFAAAICTPTQPFGRHTPRSHLGRCAGIYSGHFFLMWKHFYVSP